MASAATPVTGIPMLTATPSVTAPIKKQPFQLNLIQKFQPSVFKFQCIQHIQHHLKTCENVMDKKDLAKTSLLTAMSLQQVDTSGKKIASTK